MSYTERQIRRARVFLQRSTRIFEDGKFTWEQNGKTLAEGTENSVTVLFPAGMMLYENQGAAAIHSNFIGKAAG